MGGTPKKVRFAPWRVQCTTGSRDHKRETRAENTLTAVQSSDTRGNRTEKKSGWSRPAPHAGVGISFTVCSVAKSTVQRTNCCARKAPPVQQCLVHSSIAVYQQMNLRSNFWIARCTWKQCDDKGNKGTRGLRTLIRSKGKRSI